MAAQQNILREYLVALGFRVNETQERRMNTTVLQMDRRVIGLGKAAVAAATAVVGVTTALAKSWERMFYSARYADTTVEKLQGIEFGARNVGLEAGRMTATVKQFAATIRNSPGLTGFLESLGVQVQGRTKDKVFVDFLKAIHSMPAWLQNRHGALFGIDPETMFNLQQDGAIEALEKAAALREKMNRDAGLDAENAAKTGVEYMNLWRQVEARAGVFGQTLMIAVLPTVRELVAETDKLLLKWTMIVKDIGEHGSGQFWKRLREGVGIEEPGAGRVSLTPEARARLGLPEKDLPGGDLSGRKGVGLPRAMQEFQMWRERSAAARDGRADPFANRVATDDAAVDAAQNLDAFRSGGRGGPLPPPNLGTSAYTRWKDRERDGTVPPDVAAMFAALERKYDLPAGMLDRIWLAESSRGRNMVSPKGALGHMGFMPATAKEFGLKDPMDLEQSAEAAARKMSGLLRMYDGDRRQAAAAYNWGEGNLSKYHLGQQPMPEETQKYMDKVGGPAPSIQQDVTINVHGSGDPHEAAQSVVRLQKDVGRDLARNFSAKVR